MNRITLIRRFRNTAPVAFIAGLAVACAFSPVSSAQSSSTQSSKTSDPGTPIDFIPRNTVGAPLLLKDEGTFFINGKVVQSNYPTSPSPTPGPYVINQMYVHYRVPLLALKPAIIMIHGNGLSGDTYETTPDGREGWATYFTRHGYPVYVVDIPGRGRAGFDVQAINQAKVTNDISKVPTITRSVLTASWVSFRFGPEYGVPFHTMKFPVKYRWNLSAEGVPIAESTLQGGALQQTPDAVTALIDKIGPAIILVHSQSGPVADIVVGRRPSLVRAVVNIEGDQNTIPTDDQIAAYRKVPDLEVFGDNVIGNTASATGQARFDVRNAVVKRIQKAGGDATLLQLPTVGISGNTHMMMQDTNNLKVADVILSWLDRKLKKHH